MNYSFDFSANDAVVIRIENLTEPDEVWAELVDGSGNFIDRFECVVRGDNVEIKIRAGEVNWFTQRVSLFGNGEKVMVKPDFDFEVNKQYDVHYMNRLFFSPATRIKNPNEFCEFARSVIEVMDPTGLFYCGVLSVLAYRVSEDPVTHAELGNWLVDKRVELFSVARSPTNPLWLRWWVSSAQTISCLAIYYKRIDAALSIAKDGVEFSRYGYVNHMIYWNMASIMLIYGFLLYRRGMVVESCAIFGQLFDLCENGLRDVFNARNAALVTQHTDCIALVEIGRQAYVCHFVARNGVMPLESKMVQPMYINSFYIDFVSAVKRFPEKFRPALTELMNAKKDLNNGLARILGNPI